MTAFNASSESPGFSSTSTPCARKTSAALGSIWSAIRTLGMFVFSSCPGESRGVQSGAPAFAGELSSPRFLEGPVEPRAQCFDVVGFDRRSAPDADAGRGVAIAGDVVGRAFGFEQGCHAFHQRILPFLIEAAHGGLQIGRAHI